jgi:hypothetical protein
MQINVSHQPPDCLRLRTRATRVRAPHASCAWLGFLWSLTSSEAIRQSSKQVCRSAIAHILPSSFVVCL